MTGKVAQRRLERTEQIVATAWELATELGLLGVTLHGLAREIGIRQPSLYEYFDSKHALYDAMFADGNRRFLERLESVKLPANPTRALKKLLHAFVDFALEDPPRCELLFERRIPDFEPSPASYAIAQEALGRVVEVMRAAGVTDQGDIDCLVAITGGLMQTQRTNDPGGTRWIRHLDRMIDLVVNDATKRRLP